MSEMRVRVGVAVQAGVRVRRAQAIHDVLAFAFDVLRLGECRTAIQKGVVENRWITRVRFVGLDGEGAVREELVFEIDWERHRLHMAQGRDAIEVSAGRSLVASVSPDLLTTLRLFKEACVLGEYDLRCRLRLVEVPGTDVAARLGLVREAPFRYAGEGLSAQVRTGELDEIGAAYNRYGRTGPRT